MADFLDQTRRQIDERLAELKPLVDEYKSLQLAAEALGKVTASPANGSAAAPARRGPGRPRGSKAGTATTTRSRAARRPGRRKGTGKRAAQALAAITEQPGITVGELASKIGITKTYLYRVLPGLEGEGKVAKQGRGWHPKG